MASLQQTYKPGGIKINTIGIINYNGDFFDLRTFLHSFNIYEDMFTSTMSADVSIIDAVGLIERLPIIGDELFVIDFNTPTFSKRIVLSFDVVKIGNRKKINERGDFYTLHCVSREYTKNLSGKVDKAYNGFYISDIVNGVFRDYIKTDLGNKTLDIEKTIGRHSIVAPTTKPFEFINFLASEARSEQYPNDSCYLFWEDHDQFNFKTIANLINQSPVESYYDAIQNVEESEGYGDANESQRIIGIDYLSQFDIIKQHEQGLIDNNALIVDTIFKKHQTNTFLYNDDYNRLNHLGTDKMYKGDSRFYENDGESHSRYFVGNLSEGNYHQESYLDKRCTPIDGLAYYPSQRYRFINNKIATLATVRNIAMHIEIPGNTERKPGDVIQVYIPQSSDDDAYRLRYNKLFGQKGNAKFLVVRVVHSYATGGDFTTTMKVTKGEYGAFPSTELSEVNGL
jgi:hypothetical protein